VSGALAIALALIAVAYVWRWRGARADVSIRRVWAFLAGLVSLWIAGGSPLAHLDHGFLTAHMVQHLVIMTVAAPLLLAGEPVLVLLGGRRPISWTLRPVVCWLAGTVVVIAWHVPALFAVGMRYHGLQHATFLAGGLLFWLPVMRPWPTVLRWSRWTIPLYLFFAAMPCDALSAFLAFCGRVVYPHYASIHAHAHAHAGAFSPLADQERAGALMWFWVTIAYLVPAVIVIVELLSDLHARTDLAKRRS
jgi:putative membrane protein